jgi:zinc/manganese transport system permease protein
MLVADAGLTWNLADDISQLFEFHFMANAFRAGTIAAIVAGTIGWFVVLRRQTFVGHTLSVVAFPGAAGATLVGVSAAWGYFGFAIVAALLIAAIPRTQGHSFSEETAVVGTVQAFALALGFLFVTLYHGVLDEVDSLLFGSFLGVTDSQVTTLLVIGVAGLAVLAVIARPLLFASVDPDVATARGVPVRVLSVVFLVVLGLAVAEASQIVGVLLVFALLVIPPAIAQTITMRPLLSISIGLLIGVGITWVGLALAYFYDQPVGFYTTSLALAGYVLARAAAWGGERAQQARAST